MAFSGSKYGPPSENESGVTLTTAITRERAGAGSPGTTLVAVMPERLRVFGTYAFTGSGLVATGLLRGLRRPGMRNLGQTMKASASSAARTIRGASLRPGKTKNLGSHTGLNLALNLYSDSIWNQRDRKTSRPRQTLSTGPAPIRSPRASADRNIAKFSDICLIPIVDAFFRASAIR